mgnify:CR=1 FL=1
MIAIYPIPMRRKSKLGQTLIWILNLRCLMNKLATLIQINLDAAQSETHRDQLETTAQDILKFKPAQELKYELK